MLVKFRLRPHSAHCKLTRDDSISGLLVCFSRCQVMLEGVLRPGSAMHAQA